ncbi:MAG: class I adenylate-forming enzyme family protein [Brevundimonas sp.]
MFDRPIRFNAKLDPLAVAVSNGTEHITYQALDRMVDQVATALAASGVEEKWGREEALAAVCVRDSYLHLLLIVSCARLGVATVSLLPDHAPAIIALTRPTSVLSDDGALEGAVVTDRAWLEQAVAAPCAERPLAALDRNALARIQCSSGTTGLPKAVGLSWEMMDRRVQHTWMRPKAVNRMLSLVGPASGSLPLFLSTFARGGCNLFGPGEPRALAHSLSALAPDLILASPAQLAALLDALPARVHCLPDLQITLGGARAAAPLRRRAESMLGKVSVTYASTEGGVITFGYSDGASDDGTAGYLVPWADAEVVDDDDQPVPPGAEGRIRLRGPDVADGYLGEGPGVDGRFRDGWFYPGDLGSIAGDGLVRIHGREDELMNLGGEKHLPDALEARIRQVPGVVDAAAFALPDANGVDQPWVAVVRTSEFTLAEEDVGKALAPLGLPTVRIAWIDAIPRSPVGKVARETLRQAAEVLQAKD